MKLRTNRVIASLALGVVAGVCLGGPCEPVRATFDAAGTLDLDTPDRAHADWVFGGISSIDLVRGDWFAFLPDDRGAHGPPRVGFGRLTRDDAGDYTLADFAWHALPTPGGEAFGRDEADPEGVRVLDPGPQRDGEPTPLLAWSSEGYVKGGVAPGVFTWDTATKASAALPVPEAYLPAFEGDEQDRGVAHNRGFEGIAVLADGSLLVAPENPPVQDEHKGTPRLLRMQRYVDGKPAGDVWYPMRPVMPGAKAKYHGVSEMIALDDHRLLVLERALDAHGVQHAWLVEADLDTDKGVPMRTRTVFTFRDVAGELPNGVVPNLEAMTLVDHTDDAATLILMSDNDFEGGVPTVWVRLDLAW